MYVITTIGGENGVIFSIQYSLSEATVDDEALQTHQHFMFFHIQTQQTLHIDALMWVIDVALSYLSVYYL